MQAKPHAGVLEHLQSIKLLGGKTRDLALIGEACEGADEVGIPSGRQSVLFFSDGISKGRTYLQ